MNSNIVKYWESVGFKMGKCYENSSGRQIYICGTANTLVFGETIIVEVGHITGEGSYSWQPINIFDHYDGEFNWFEISIDKFQLCNYNNSTEEISKINDRIKEFDRRKKLKSIINKL